MPQLGRLQVLKTEGIHTIVMRYSKLHTESQRRKASGGDSRRMLLFAYMYAAGSFFRAGDEDEVGDDAEAVVSSLTARRWRVGFGVRDSGGQIISGTVSRQGR